MVWDLTRSVSRPQPTSSFGTAVDRPTSNDAPECISSIGSTRPAQKVECATALRLVCGRELETASLCPLHRECLPVYQAECFRGLISCPNLQIRFALGFDSELNNAVAHCAAYIADLLLMAAVKRIGDAQQRRQAHHDALGFRIKRLKRRVPRLRQGFAVEPAQQRDRKPLLSRKTRHIGIPH